ncbi:hypothetical protein ElyMa_000503600 [Elysia marginata]|uniref:Uncharacterized protein n=1 Tax=Elysia marginata TaxID=1093978 RepID=A0AAV4FWE7_9GAST|nr:hypothetical protein ElyMa_000503600 [Elysia marginata]
MSAASLGISHTDQFDKRVLNSINHIILFTKTKASSGTSNALSCCKLKLLQECRFCHNSSSHDMPPSPVTVSFTPPENIDPEVFIDDTPVTGESDTKIIQAMLERKRPRVEVEKASVKEDDENAFFLGVAAKCKQHLCFYGICWPQIPN